MIRFAILVATVLSVAVSGNHLPSYIQPCRVSDPNFKQCAMEQGQNAIPNLANGDKSLKLRPLDPLNIPEISIDTSGNLKLLLTDVTIIGLSKMELKDIDFDSVKRNISLDLWSDQLQVLGDYSIDGRILILPIKGNGKINVTVVDSAVGYSFAYDLTEKKGKQYVKPNMPEVSLNSKRYYFQLDNLFNGDKRLGEEMNRFLNENYEELANELNPSVTETIRTIASDIVNNIMTLVPYDELILM